MWRDPRAVIGGSDAGAHLDMMCGAIYSTALLAHGVREFGVVTLEEAVRLLTDVPASLYGLRRRGRIVDGYAADLVLFDADRVGYGAERTRADLPGGAWRLYAESTGIERVLVNGVPVLAGGALAGATPGTPPRSSPRPPWCARNAEPAASIASRPATSLIGASKGKAPLRSVTVS